MDLNLPKKRTFIGPASIWKRLLAFVIDLFLVDFFIVGPFRKVIGNILPTPESFTETFVFLESNPAQMDLLLLIFTLASAIIIAYFVLSQYLIGQTLGCRLLRIKVVTPADAKGKVFVTPNFWQCLVRNMFLLPFVPFILLWIADPVYYFIAKKHQRLSEWLSRSQVVEVYAY
ncbi:RDD family protein [Candidatus Woesearchaeota archaeon]|nr:RDD family protein [Candidatus Woesearchaeota archaeon]